MKNSIKYVIVFIIFLVGYQILFNILKSEHQITYKYLDKDDTYEINENYIRNEEYEIYYIDVNSNDNHYIFTVNNHFNKQKNIVKSIKKYSNNDIECMVIRLINDEFSEPMCIKDNMLHSYYSVKEELDLDDKLGKYEYKYKNSTDEDENAKPMIGKNKIFANSDYLDENEYIVVYNIKKLLIYNKHFVDSVVFGTKDNYYNKYGIMIGKYYIVPSILDKPDINSFIIHNVEKRLTDNITIKTSISKQSFNNGVYKNELYITDKSNYKQYKLNPIKMTFELVAGEDEEGLVINKGEEEFVSIYKIADDELHFTEAKNKTYKGIESNMIYPNDIFAYYYKDGAFYKVYEKYKDNPILLFESNDPKNVIVRKDNIYFIEGTNLYKYNKNGLNVLINYNEFEFNYENIFNVYYE